MIQTVATMISLILAVGAGGIIAVSLAEDWGALRDALRHADPSLRIAPLPARVRRLTGARGARIIRLAAEPGPRRVAA